MVEPAAVPAGFVSLILFALNLVIVVQWWLLLSSSLVMLLLVLLVVVIYSVFAVCRCLLVGS